MYTYMHNNDVQETKYLIVMQHAPLFVSENFARKPLRNCGTVTVSLMLRSSSDVIVGLGLFEPQYSLSSLIFSALPDWQSSSKSWTFSSKICCFGTKIFQWQRIAGDEYGYPGLTRLPDESLIFRTVSPAPLRSVRHLLVYSVDKTVQAASFTIMYSS